MSVGLCVLRGAIPAGGERLHRIGLNPSKRLCTLFHLRCYGNQTGCADMPGHGVCTDAPTERYLSAGVGAFVLSFKACLKTYLKIEPLHDKMREATGYLERFSSSRFALRKIILMALQSTLPAKSH